MHCDPLLCPPHICATRFSFVALTHTPPSSTLAKTTLLSDFPVLCCCCASRPLTPCTQKYHDNEQQQKGGTPTSKLRLLYSSSRSETSAPPLSPSAVPVSLVSSPLHTHTHTHTTGFTGFLTARSIWVIFGMESGTELVCDKETEAEPRMKPNPHAHLDRHVLLGPMIV